jgi:hypothetical protein
MTDTAAPTLTIADVQQSDYLALLQPHPDASYTDLETIFRQAMNAASADGKSGAARALRLLAGVCSLRLTPEDKTAVYRRMVDFSDGSGSMHLEHLGADEIAVLAQLADRIPHPALRGRLADLVWIREKRCGADFARAAVTAYCSLPIRRDAWLGERERCWHRALQLALQVRWTEQVETIEQALLGAFFASTGAIDHEPLGYLKPLRAERRSGGQAARVAAELADLGQRHLDTGRAFCAETFFRAAADWFDWARKPEQRARMEAYAAESIGLQGDAGDGAIVRRHWYTKAIAAYRLVNGRYHAALDVESKIDALRRKLDKAGHQAIGEMAAIPLPNIEVTDRVQAAIDHVKGRGSFDAMLAFCGLDSPFVKMAIEAAAERNVSQSVFSDIIDVGVLAADGRQVDRRDALDRTGRIAAEARGIFRQHAATVALAEILPALSQLKFEHAFGLDDFVALAERSPVVPADRATMLGQGLYAGYCGDMVQAIHILMPQFEHLVRQVLKGADAFTTHHNQDGLDLEIGLSALVEREQMEQEFGYGLTLAIHALMCDKSGPNLRNEVAHGLATQDLCESAHALYAWWMILQLVAETCAAAVVTVDTREAGEQAAEGAPPHADPGTQER